MPRKPSFGDPATPMTESIEYQHTLLTLRQIALGYPGTITHVDWRCFDDDDQRAMGPGTGFEFADDDAYRAAYAEIGKQAKAFWLHPDTLRFFREDSLIFVRRPNCHNCGGVYAEHVLCKGRALKCLFESTDYCDSYHVRQRPHDGPHTPLRRPSPGWRDP